jgi:hypothetical protein
MMAHCEHCLNIPNYDRTVIVLGNTSHFFSSSYVHKANPFNMMRNDSSSSTSSEGGMDQPLV